MSKVPDEETFESEENIIDKKLIKDANKQISVALMQIIFKYKFFGSVLAHCDVRVVDEANKLKEIKTAAVDKNGIIFCNPKFIMNMSVNTTIGVLCHEVMHVIFLHLSRYPDKNYLNFKIWNIATDSVINDILKNLENLELPSEGIIPKSNGDLELKDEYENPLIKLNVRDKPAEVVYWEIVNQLKAKGKVSHVGSLSGSSGNGSDDDSSSSGGLDAKGFDKHIMDKNPDGSNPGSDSVAKDAKKWGSIVAEANMNASKDRSSSDDWCSRLLKDLLRPQLDWRSVLRSKIKACIPYNFTYRNPSKRSLATKIYMPIIYKRPEQIIIAIDVSGSISDEEMQIFWSEVYGIVRSYENIEVRVIFWSTHVDNEHELVFNSKTLRNSLSIDKINTTGGTELSCVKDFLIDPNRKYKYKNNFVIVFTDGCVESEPDVVRNSLFVISKEGNDGILRNYGTCIRLSE